ncbi:uncharacterized protein [Eurosta solidaginis]|uniref:uncharacterized protein n=1 Tax=Eurosta solidaginis TaxID=178769 RepID=UPI0035305F63
MVFSCGKYFKMVRNYKRKTQSNVDESKMKKAIADVLNGVETPTSASKKYNLKRQTIESRVKKHGHKNVDAIYQSKFTWKQVFTIKEEAELVDYVKKCCYYQYGLSYKNFQKLAYQYAVANGKEFPENWNVNNEAGIDWLHSFMKRNPSLSLRKPEKTSLARLTGFSKKAVDEFYSNLRNLYEKYSFQSNDIYNLDETGITTVVESPKIIAPKGQRQVGQAVSAERGSLVSLVGIINASGNRLPPAFVFPRVRYNPQFLNGCVTGSLGLVSKSGWMMSELFIDVLKHIQNNTKCSKENPILLLLDNHSSHCSINSINYSRENGIHLLSFPPHTSHRLQPLDVSVYGPFKKFVQTSFYDFMTNNPGKRITIYEVAQLTNLPFQRAFKSENIISGFQSTGIYPFNSQNFSEDDFCLAAETNEDALTEPVPLQPDNIVNTSITDPLEPNNSTNVPVSLTPEQIRPISRLNASKITAKTGCSRILTSSCEKKRLEEKAAGINTQSAKRNIQFSGKENIPKNKSKKNKRKKVQPKTRKHKSLVRMQIDSSDESNMSVEYADTDQSVGSFVDGEETSEAVNFSSHEFTDDFELNVGDFVLTLPAQTCKKKVYYVAEIIETLSECTFTASFLRKLDVLQPIFVKPENKDISLVLKSEILFKLPNPVNPASTSRCRTKYIFETDLGGFNIK